MDRHVENARKVAEYLSSHPKVSWVNYAGLPGNKYYPLAQKYLPKGVRSIFTFGVKAGKEAPVPFIDHLELFSHLPMWQTPNPSSSIRPVQLIPSCPMKN